MPKTFPDEPGRSWWRDGVLYQIYPRSYMDANGDGVGDLRGVIDRLDYLQWLGVDGIWLDPITVSPNADWGYDVSDYVDVDPELGTLADADELLAEAGARGIRVLLDLVPNHTSDQHPWFLDAKSSRTSKHRDWYVWADPRPDGSPPNNWVNSFDPRDPAWTLDETSGQYYLHNFLQAQPDLNWWNEEVRAAFDDIYRFWYDRGVAGFRLDVAHAVVKDRDLRDNPPSTEDDHPYTQMRGQRQTFNTMRPEVHEVLRRWRALADSYEPQRILVGETYVFEPNMLASFYGRGDEVNLAFNLMFLHANFGAVEIREIVEAAEALIPAGSQPTWAAGSHDNRRVATRWGDNDPMRTRAAMLTLLTLRGTPFIYYGDELGMPQSDVPVERVLDPVGIIHGPRIGRDGERTPMQWTAEPGAGFTGAAVEPWLPFGDPSACNVAQQQHDPDSMLSLTRDLIGLRNAIPELRSGAYATHPASSDALWAWSRGDRALVAINFSDAAQSVPDVNGAIRISSIRARDGEAVSDALHLEPWESAIVWRD
jgi:alpha-glucosidase